MASEVEVITDRRRDGGEFLKTAHRPEPCLGDAALQHLTLVIGGAIYEKRARYVRTRYTLHIGSKLALHKFQKIGVHQVWMGGEEAV